MRKHAAHVAAWIAYGPEGRIPEVAELELLKKFIDKVGAGLLPSRLNEVLPDAQAVLRMVSTGQAGEGWTQAERKLRESLQKFRCCRGLADKAGAKPAAEENVEEIVMVSDLDVVETGLQPEEAILLQVDEDDDDPESSGASKQHLQLVSKINEWGFLDDGQRVERLQQAEEAARRRRKNVSQEELTEVINTAAAALAAPRRRATQREVDSEGSEEAKTATQPQDPKPDLQRRVRALLLDALNLWRTKQYGCSAIAHVLDFVQVKISKFEDNVGEIRGAAAGKAWLSIKDAVEEMLQGVSALGEFDGGNRAVEADRTVRLERQSGIQGITWDRLKMCWCLSWYEAGKRPRRSFPAAKFLRQGLCEDEAVEAALQEVKAFREELVRQGRLQPPKPTSPAMSPVRGVAYDKTSGSWLVRLTDPSTKRRVHGGTFETQEEAEAKAREMAKKLGVPVESKLVPVKKFSELHRFEKLGPQKGVKWDIKEQCWHARCIVGVKHKHLRARPKDFSKLELEKSWNEAVAWRQQQEQRINARSGGLSKPPQCERMAAAL